MHSIFIFYLNTNYLSYNKYISMSFFGVQLNAQVNKLNLQIKLNLSRNRHMPNFRTLYKAFVAFDKQLTGYITLDQFEKGLNKNGIFFKQFEIQAYQKAYSDKNGNIHWFTFLNNLRQPMNPERRAFVNRVFDYLDTEKKNSIHYTHLMKYFNPKEFQEFKEGKKSKDILQRELLNLVNLTPEGFLTRDEFVNFYDDLNINIPGESSFELYVSAAWGYSEQKAQKFTIQEVQDAIKKIRFKLIQKTQGTHQEFLLKKVFDEFDYGKQGSLRLEDLTAMLIKLETPIQKRLIQSVFNQFDRNGSSLIEYNEFKNFIFFDPYHI